MCRCDAPALAPRMWPDMRGCVRIRALESAQCPKARVPPRPFFASFDLRCPSIPCTFVGHGFAIGGLSMRRLLGLVAAAAVSMALLALTAGQALASHVQCGDVITQDTTLDSDLTCSGEPGADHRRGRRDP